MRYKHSSNEEGKCFHLGLIYYSRYESCQEIRALFLLYISLSSRRVNRMIESVEQGSEKGCRSDQTACAYSPPGISGLGGKRVFLFVGVPRFM